MSASVSSIPSTKTLHKDHIWLEISTNLVSNAKSNFQLNSTGNNNAGEEIALTFGGTTLTFTLAASPDNSGLQLPVRSGGTDEEYAEELAEAFRANEIITNEFVVYTTHTSGSWCVIQAKESKELAVSHTTDISNITVFDYSSAGPYNEDNLRSIIEVWSDTGDTNTDAQLGQQHAIYDPTRGTAIFDVHSHFAHLKPHLPSTNSFEIPPPALRYGQATDMYQKWYFRYADKYGSPVVSEKMKKYGISFYTFYGAHSGEALTSLVGSILHLRRRKDGQMFWKPISRDQPDYIYFLANASAPELKHSVTLYWSDGTTNTYTPFPGMSAGLTAGELYWVQTGYKQLKIDQQTPPSSGAYVYRYEFNYENVDPVTIWTVRYQVVHDCHDWGMNLIYANGLGGMETVWLGGISQEDYNTIQEVARRIRTPDWDIEDGDLHAFNTEGQIRWTARTLLFDDPYYLDHLRQLPMAGNAWIVDTENDRYLPVIVEAGELQSVRQDDGDLYSLEFTLQAAWLDRASNF